MWKSIRRVFSREVYLKVKAVLLACAFLVVVLYLRLGSKKFEHTLIEVVNVPESLSLLSVEPESVTVQLRGPEDQLDELSRISSGELKIQIAADLMPLGFPEELITESNPILTRSVRLGDPSVRYIVPQPAGRYVQVEEDLLRGTTVTMEFAVHTEDIRVATPIPRDHPRLPPRMVGPHHYLDPTRIRMEPDSVVVRGAPGVLENLKDRALPLSDRWLDFVCAEDDPERVYRAPYAIDFAAVGVKPFRSEDRTVEAVFLIERTDQRQEFEVRDIQFDSLAHLGKTVSYEAKKVTVVLEGRNRILDQVNPESIKVRFDVTPALKESPKTVEAPYEVVLPEGLDVRVTELKPEVLPVTVKDIEPVPEEGETAPEEATE